jgi:LCP family protein required for cell wall assembly
MKLHKALFIACILVSSILFVNGISVLAQLNNKTQINDKIKVERAPKPDDGFLNQVKQAKHEDSAKQEDHTIMPSESNVRTEKPVNVLLLGLDGEETRTDVIALLNYSLTDGKINILSIARDTRVYVNGKQNKINALMGIGGIKLTISAVEKITGLTIDYYLALNFKGFRNIIDTLGGIEINVPMNMDYDDPEQGLHIHLKKGLQILDGKKAEQFVRYRKGNRKGQGYTDGDIGRIKAQQEFMKALIHQKLKLQYLSKVDDIFFVLKDNMKTNIQINDIRRYLKYFKYIDHDSVKTYTMPGEAKYTNKTWYYICNRKKTRELIYDNFYR